MLTEIASSYREYSPLKSRKSDLIIVVIDAIIMHFPLDITRQMTDVTNTMNQQMQENWFEIYDM